MRTIFLLTLVTSLIACSGKSDADKPLLDEAARYHTEATTVQERVEPLIDQIDSVRTLLAQKTSPDAKKTAQSLDSLKTAFEEWEANLVEIPGMKHEHHEHGKGEHHHHHDHNNDTKDLPASQMRDLQREFLINIKQISALTQQALDRAKNVQ